MGAFDMIYGAVACPSCGTFFHLAEQTKFFLPDFGGYNCRGFTVGVPQPLDFDPAPLSTARTWDDQWWRVRAPCRDGLALLADLDALLTCHCGTPLVFVFEFTLAGGASPEVTLTALRALDARDPGVAAAVDSADAERIAHWDGNLAAWCERVESLGALEPAARERLLREALAARFPSRSEPDGAPHPGGPRAHSSTTPDLS